MSRRKYRWTSIAAFTALLALLLGTPVLLSQQSSSPVTRDPSAISEFNAAADDVLAEMSEITGLKLRTPLKKTLRSRDEIRAYVVREMDQEKNPAERYAAARSAEAFGLLPPDFPYDTFMTDLLTEQIAGLYDPKAREFYIADWIPPADQRMVMAHELTHALQDQYFNIEPWVKAARPNDDAELAREAVLEGSATAAMIDYLIRGTGRSLQDLPDFDPSMFLGELGATPTLSKAPPFLKDALVFPYLSGLQFSKVALKKAGWASISTLFQKPPASTQQILHPELYASGKPPVSVELPPLAILLGQTWSKLDENVLGEFGLQEALKQFLGADRAKSLAPAWEGDLYAVYESKETKHLVLQTRFRLASDEQAAHFFGLYSELLEKKYADRSRLLRRPNFFSFDTPQASVFLRCVGSDCITLEGASRTVFDAFNKAMNWPPAPELNLKPGETATTVASRPSSAVVPAAFALR
jgi:hypothetical protein